MKLNTKNLFSSPSSAKKSKYIQKKSVKFSLSSFNTKEKTAKSNSVKKTEPKTKDSKSSKVNPFNQNFVRKSNRHKSWVPKKTQSSKFEKFHLNDILLTNESDSNHNDENDFDTLCKMFQNSELKSTIILDNNGNSNLNNEDKKFIEDYLNKKETLKNNINKCKINSIKVQNYNHNNILLKKMSNNLAFNDKRKVSDEPFLYTKLKNKINNYFDFSIKSEDENEDNNSIFEHCVNKSFDSSFLGSSLAEDFIIPFKETK